MIICCNLNDLSKKTIVITEAQSKKIREIAESYFTPEELLSETKTYYINMDVKIKEDSRTAPKMTPSELEDEFKKIWDKYNTENQPYRLGRFIYNMLKYNKKANSPYKILNKFYDDMSKINADCENLDPIGDIRTTKSGIPYVLCFKGGDWECPMLFMVYYDGEHIRGYIPTKGNCINTKTKKALEDDSAYIPEDFDFVKSQYKDKSDDEIKDIIRGLHYNKDACIADFEKHIKVSGKYKSKKYNVSESIYLTESLLLEADLNDIYTKYYSNVPENEFWDIIKADPTYNPQKSQKMGKFGKWLLNLYKQNRLRLEDLYKATDYLSYFVKYYNKIENKDINKIPDLPSLFNVIKPFKEAADNGEEMATSKSDEIRRIKQDAEKFYEDDIWLVVIPHSQEASCYYGKNTQWCTAATDSYNMFNQYYSKGLLYININKKTNKKYQFHFEEAQFMDETDEFIHGIISKTIGMTGGLLQAYAKKYGGRAIIALTRAVDWDKDDPIEGDEPYYLYADYDDYYSIVQTNGINVVPCRGIPEDMTDENDPRYVGNYLFCYHDMEDTGYYDEEEDYYYNTDEYAPSDSWTIYNAKTQQTISTGNNDVPYKFNDKYIRYDDANGTKNLVDAKTMRIVFRTNKVISDLDYHMGYAKNPVKYSDDLIFIREPFNNDGHYDEHIQLYDIANNKQIPLPENYKIGNYYYLNGKDYLTLKSRKVDMEGEFNGRIKSILIYPDGRLSKPFYNDDLAKYSGGFTE